MLISQVEFHRFSELELLLLPQHPIFFLFFYWPPPGEVEMKAFIVQNFPQGGVRIGAEYPRSKPYSKWKFTRKIGKTGKYFITQNTYLNGEPKGVATPNPFESKFRPTFMVSQGFLSFM